MSFEPNTVVAMLVAGVAGFALGWFLSVRLSGLQERVRELERLRDSERAETEKAIGRIRREMAEVNAVSREQAEVFQILPDTVRQLFAAAAPRAIAPVVLKLTELLLRPEQACLFLVRRNGERLALAGGIGLPASIALWDEVPVGAGRVGYAATARAVMDDTDFRTLPGERVTTAQETHRNLQRSGLDDLRVDVAAPIREGDTAMGVLTLGGVRARRGQEKRLAGMIADLAAFALRHGQRLRASEESASLDGLTGLYSRGYFEARFEAELQIAERDGEPLTLALFDIDHFEHYNRTNSHLAGDEALKRIGHILRSSVRADDLVGRWGGEELAVVFLRADKDRAIGLADTLRRAVEDYPFRFRGHQPGGLFTVSAGVASFPEDARLPDALVRSAEEALDMAKAGGRNQIVAATPSFLE